MAKRHCCRLDKRPKLKPVDSAVVRSRTKTETVRDLGFSSKQVEWFEPLSEFLQGCPVSGHPFPLWRWPTDSVPHPPMIRVWPIWRLLRQFRRASLGLRLDALPYTSASPGSPCRPSRALVFSASPASCIRTNEAALSTALDLLSFVPPSLKSTDRGITNR